jgi:L-threonylcarbamoyladenylate synthase
LVRGGGLVVYPTDTVYGLGCDPFNEKAVHSLVEAKERKTGRLPLLVKNMEKAEKIGRFQPIARSLASVFWPGPLTLVVPLGRGLPTPVTDGTNTVGLRVPGRKDTLTLIEACGGAIVGTSANISGGTSSRTAAEALRQLEGRVGLVLDGGTSPVGVESTVVSIVSNQVSVLREGAIPKESIFAAIKGSRNGNALEQPC